jgi:phage-related holin
MLLKLCLRFQNLFNDTWGLIVKIFSFILLWLAPISNYVHLVLILIAIDLITGSYASVKEGEHFSARKLSRTIEKFIFYAIAIIVAYVLQRIVNDGTELSRIVALYIGATECKSIYENITRITKTDFLALVWTTIKEKLDEYINLLKNKNNDPE